MRCECPSDVNDDLLEKEEKKHAKNGAVVS
jgi:hypothetical protein